MLDVHPPSHAVNTWRDFFTHIVTITIGLLIALTLEGSAEWFHHRHLLREAQDNLKQEIHDNRVLLQDDLKNIRADEDRMRANLVYLRAMRKDPKNPNKPHFTIAWSSFNESAWRTARDTGALALMPYHEVQIFSDVYAQQDFATSLALSLFNSQSQSTAPLLMEDASAGPTTAQIDEVLHDCAGTLVQLRNLEQVILDLDQNYTEATKEL